MSCSFRHWSFSDSVCSWLGRYAFRILAKEGALWKCAGPHPPSSTPKSIYLSLDLIFTLSSCLCFWCLLSYAYEYIVIIIKYRKLWHELLVRRVGDCFAGTSYKFFAAGTGQHLYEIVFHMTHFNVLYSWFGESRRFFVPSVSEYRPSPNKNKPPTVGHKGCSFVEGECICHFQKVHLWTPKMRTCNRMQPHFHRFSTDVFHRKYLCFHT